VLELPMQRPTMAEPPPEAQPAVSLAGLRKSFAQAARGPLSEQAGRVWNFFEDSLKELLAEECHIGWGSRLKRQIDAYVPVVCAAGGNAGEAADQLLASKILNKVEHHYEIGVDALGRVRDAVGVAWGAAGLDDEPLAVQALLSRAIRRRGRN
jgi:hypothetical protein